MKKFLLKHIVLFVFLHPIVLHGQIASDTVTNPLEFFYENLSSGNPIEWYGFDHHASNKKELAQQQSRQSISLGMMGVLGLNIVNAILADKYDWNLWIDVPVMIAASGALMTPFVLRYMQYWETKGANHYDVEYSIVGNRDTAAATLVSQKLNHIAKLYGTSSVEYGRWMMYSSSVCMIKSDFDIANQLLKDGEGILRKNGKGPLGGLDTIDELFYRHMMTFIEVACDRDFYAIKHCRRATELAKQHFGPDSKVYLNFLLQLSALQAQRLHYRQSLKTHSEGHQAYVQMIKDEFCQRSDIGRANYWQSAKGYIYATVDMASILSKKRATRRSRPIAGPTYNALLLSKGLLLNTTVGFENHIKSCNVPKANALLEQKKKLLSDKAPNDILDSIDLEILHVLRESDMPFTIPSLEITWDSVQLAMGEDDLAIEFFRSRSYDYGAVLLRKDWDEPQVVMLDNRVKLAGKYYTLDEALKQQVLIVDTFTSGDLWELGRAIWCDEIVKHFPVTADGHVFFSADGEMQVNGIEYLPFLPVNSSKADERYRYVLVSDVYKMCRLSSTRELALRRQSSQNDRAAIFGGLRYDFGLNPSVKGLPYKRINYLEGTRMEALNISAIFEGDDSQGFDVRLFSDTSGTEETFKKLMPNDFHLIHLATHGFVGDDLKEWPRIWTQIDTTNPMATSALLLASAENKLFGFENLRGTEDGILTSQEISMMDLHSTDLVVLSACVTGKGFVGEDGVVGLQRGFKMAGVNSILMSLWSVEDLSTSLLMTYFYENLYKSGFSKQKALLEAMKSVRNFEVDSLAWKMFNAAPEEETWGHFLAEQRGGYKRYKPLSTTSVKTTTDDKRIKPYEKPVHWAAFILLDAID